MASNRANHPSWCRPWAPAGLLPRFDPASHNSIHPPGSAASSASPWSVCFPAVATREDKLLCSYGGEFRPCPGDVVLHYFGGKHRIVIIRRDATLDNILLKMAEMYRGPVVLRCQPLHHGLGLLISVHTPVDVKLMLEEYDGLITYFPNGKHWAYLSSSTKPSDLGLILMAKPRIYASL